MTIFNSYVYGVGAVKGPWAVVIFYTFFMPLVIRGGWGGGGGVGGDGNVLCEC